MSNKGAYSAIEIDDDEVCVSWMETVIRPYQDFLIFRKPCERGDRTDADHAGMLQAPQEGDTFDRHAQLLQEKSPRLSRLFS